MDAKRSRISAVLTILWYWYSTNSHRANGLGRLSRRLSSHQTISRYPLPDSCLQLGPNHLFVIPILSPFEMDVIPGFARVRFVITKTQAAALQTKWKQLPDPPLCEHRQQEMESSDNGYLTGNYRCLLCG